MKQLKQVSILSLFFLLFTSAISIVGGTKLSNTYSSSEHKFQISYPGTWKIDTKDPNLILLLGPIIDTVTHLPDDEIAIQAKVNSKVIPTTEVYKASMKDIQASAKDFKINEEGEMFLGEVKSKYVIYQTKIGAAIITSVQFYFSNGKTSFILSGSMLEETLGKYKDLYFDIAKSIKFTKK